jgi:transcriptional regulator with GAF, ATPase, and Fis domain
MSLQAQLILQVLDIALLCAALGVLTYAVVRAERARSMFPLGGQLLLIGGAALFVVTYLADTALPMLLGALQAGPGTAIADFVPANVYWLLTRAAFVLFGAGLFVGTRHRKQLEGAFTSSKDEVRSAREKILRAEARFRALFETTTNSIFCYAFEPPLPIALPVEEQVARSHDAILVECNSVFARALGADDPEEVIGTRMGRLEGNRDADAHFAYFKAFVDGDYRLSDYEFVFTAPDGRECALRSSLTGIIEDGKLQRFWGAETNESGNRQARAAFARQREYQELLARISTRLVMTPVANADTAVRQSMLELCRYAGADRTALLWYDPRTNVVDVAQGYDATGREFVAPVSVEKFPECVRQLRDGQVVRVDDVDAMPAEFAADRDALAERGIRALLALPLDVDEEVVGVATYVDARNAHHWTDHEILDLRILGNLIASFMQRIRSARALDEALARLRQATDRLEAENVYLQQEIRSEHKFDEIIGRSQPMLQCLRQVGQVAATTAPVLLLGETGTGKELVARAIHAHSERRARALVKVNCAALPASLIESELFGYEKGAFTGADSAKRGRFDLADGSTLFLDEIGEIPLELQPKLLRALQDGEIERLGGTETRKVDVRIIAATNRDLWDMVGKGEFRSDLFFRINAFPIILPALRDRGDDIQLLVEFFTKTHAEAIGKEIRGISAGMMRQLREYAWPGNVRELDGVIQRAVITSPGPMLELGEPLLADDAGPENEDDGPAIISTTISELKLVEREHILAALDETGWKISGESGAAAKLGIPPSTLRSKMKRLAIVRPD